MAIYQFLLLQVLEIIYIVTYQAHPALVKKKANQMSVIPVESQQLGGHKLHASSFNGYDVCICVIFFKNQTFGLLSCALVEKFSDHFGTISFPP